MMNIIDMNFLFNQNTSSESESFSITKEGWYANILDFIFCMGTIGEENSDLFENLYGDMYYLWT